MTDTQATEDKSTKIDSSGVTTATSETVAPVEAIIDNLEVSKPAEEKEEQPLEAVTKNSEEQEKPVSEDDGDSRSSSDDDGEAPKELGLVISALQSTVKQNQEKEKAQIEEQKVEEEQAQGDEEVVEEELHSGDDNESETKSSVGDDNSVSTSASTNVSQEEEKVVIEKTTTTTATTTTTITEEEEETTTTTTTKEIPNTFEEIVQDILPPTPGVAPQRQTFDFGGRPSEDVGDVESYSANLIALNKIDTKEIKANLLSPRQQERAGKQLHA